MTAPDERGGGRERGTDAAGRESRGAVPGRRAVDRARLDAVFGETLPETTTDEVRDRGSGIDDDWWRDQRPPHHG
ncbi:MAG TPA: hypothetical protein H9755_08475 [Candidatus Dietzia intestinigallinarum]|nr:hypothetical protein [Candidatus Dietzia intestinigallinarum]